MLKYVSASLFAFLLSSTQTLAWEFSSDSDPLDDSIFAAIAEIATTQRHAILIKCWQNKPNNILVMLMSEEPFDNSANYPASVDVQLRFDKNQIETISMAPRSADGKFALQGALLPKSDWARHIDALAEAKKQMVFGVAGQIIVFPANGSGKAVKKLKDTCKLP